MFLHQKPLPGYWYSNLSSQLIQVRAILYASGKCNRIMLEDINGSREIVDVDSWAGMGLMLHSQAAEQQRATRDR